MHINYYDYIISTTIKELEYMNIQKRSLFYDSEKSDYTRRTDLFDKNPDEIVSIYDCGYNLTFVYDNIPLTNVLKKINFLATQIENDNAYEIYFIDENKIEIYGHHFPIDHLLPVEINNFDKINKIILLFLLTIGITKNNTKNARSSIES